MQEKILIKGAGEMASAVAHRLFKCGFPVVMTDIDKPTAVRRRVSFCSAIYQNEVTVEGVRGLYHAIDEWTLLNDCDWSHIPVFADPEARLVSLLHPEIIIDGRMLKKNLGNSLSDARLVIGLGPELEAGRDVHYVIETNRGHCLGRIIREGKADSNTGRPGNIAGYTYERVLKAPADGMFESAVEIGNRVAAGDVIGYLAGATIKAEIAGVIRGIIMSGIHVPKGQKLADIDPRAQESFCALISDKARTISGSVLELVVAYACKQNY